MNQETAADNAVASERFGQDIERLMAGLVDGPPADLALEIDELAERSCVQPEKQAPQTNTSWLGRAVAKASPEKLDEVARFFEAQGFETINNTTAHGERRLFMEQGDLGVQAGYLPSTGHIEVMLSSPCLDHPEDHQMVRSEMDPDYGKSSQYYADGEGA